MIRNRRLFFLFLSALAVFCGPSRSKGDEAKTLVVMIDHSSTGFTYRVDGKTTTADFLTYLDTHKSDWASEKTKVIVLVHEQTTLAMINN